MSRGNLDRLLKYMSVERLSYIRKAVRNKVSVKSRTNSDFSGQRLANSDLELRLHLPENYQVPLSPSDLTRPFIHPLRIPNPSLYPSSLVISRSITPSFHVRVTSHGSFQVFAIPLGNAPLAPLEVIITSDSSPTRLASSVLPHFSYTTIMLKTRVPLLPYVPNPMHPCIFPLRYSNLYIGLKIFCTAICI
jgi:hypothetical protein